VSAFFWRQANYVNELITAMYRYGPNPFDRDNLFQKEYRIVRAIGVRDAREAAGDLPVSDDTDDCTNISLVRASKKQALGCYMGRFVRGEVLCIFEL